jgi:hypothetical protein
MNIISNDMITLLCEYLDETSINSYRQCTKYVCNVLDQPVVNKMLFNRLYPYLSINAELNYKDILKKIKNGICKIEDNTLVVANGPQYGDNYWIKQDDGSLFLNKAVWYFSIEAKLTLSPGKYNVYWRIKLDQNAITKLLYFILEIGDIVQESRTKDFTVEEQKIMRGQEWKTVCSHHLDITENCDIRIFLKNETDFCNGYYIDAVYVLPEHVSFI